MRLAQGRAASRRLDQGLRDDTTTLNCDEPETSSNRAWNCPKGGQLFQTNSQGCVARLWSIYNRSGPHDLHFERRNVQPGVGRPFRFSQEVAVDPELSEHGALAGQTTSRDGSGTKAPISDRSGIL